MARRGRGAGVRTEVKGWNKLTDIERGLVVPLVEIAKSIRDQMRVRIRGGLDADRNSFLPLGAGSADKPGSSLWWVPPDQPQPAGWLAEPQSGKWVGWKGYRSYRDYIARTGDRRTFFRTGGLLEALAIKVQSVAAVRIYFQGSRAKRYQDGRTTRTNYRDIAYFNSFKESNALLAPSKGELTTALEILEDSVARQVLGTASDLKGAQGMRKRADNLTRRVSAASRGR
jgi:hypothetical protein